MRFYKSLVNQIVVFGIPILHKSPLKLLFMSVFCHIDFFTGQWVNSCIIHCRRQAAGSGNKILYLLGMVANITEEFRQFYAMTMANPPWVPGVVLDAFAQRYQQSRDELEEIFRDFRASPPMEPRLADIKCPALLVWGRKDRLIDVSSVAVWSKGIADLRVEIGEGVGHMPMVEQPAHTARLYGEFLASQRSHLPV